LISAVFVTVVVQIRNVYHLHQSLQWMFSNKCHDFIIQIWCYEL